MQNALISPISSAARKAPGIEPRPPTTTTTNASEISDEVDVEAGGLARNRERAAQAGEQRAEREHRR